MVALQRQAVPTYQIETVLVPFEEVMLIEKKLPALFINETNNGVTPAFIQWCKPFIGSAFPSLTS